MSKTSKARINNKCKTEAEWILDVYTDSTKATKRNNPFIPNKGELIIFSADATTLHDRFKFGDGETDVIELPFAGAAEIAALEEQIASLGTDLGQDITNLGEELAEEVEARQARDEEINSALNNKVPKENGKGLSANDYTNTDKNKLASIKADEINKEAYLTWGGKNFTGSYGPIDAAMIPELGANRFAFLKTPGVTLEYTTNMGDENEEWTVLENESIKKNLFGGTNASFQIGNSTTTGIDKSKYGCRVTIRTTSGYANVYSILNKFVIYISSKGSSGCYCTIEARTEANRKNGINEWRSFASKTPISGWSGWNIINTSNLTTHGNDDTQHSEIRLTFGVEEHLSTSGYEGLAIQQIMAFGGVGWVIPSNMAKHGHLYEFDSNQNAIFPARVIAKEFYVRDGAVDKKIATESWVTNQGYVKNTQIADASNNGLMSSEDKKHLNSIWKIWEADEDDTLVNKVEEILTVFNNYPEGEELAGALSGKLSNGNKDMSYHSSQDSNPNNPLTWSSLSIGDKSKHGILTLRNSDTYLDIQINGTLTGTGNKLYIPAVPGEHIIATQDWVSTQGYTKNTGTVTSVGISVPTGLSVTSTPITQSGTIAISLASGYSIPTTAKQTNWDTAYGWGDHSKAGYIKSFNDTKNTAGSINSDSKLYLIGATAQSAESQTYSDSDVYTTNGTLTTVKTQVGGGAVTLEYDSNYKALKFVFA